MRLIRLAARLTTLAVVAVLSTAATPPQRANWNTTVAVTPTGSHQLGNPAAPIKVVEYISYTCSHCAQFQRDADVPLRVLYVQPGKVQIEIRHLVRDPIDMTVAMLTNCGAPARFYLNHGVFLQNQDAWLARVDRTSATQKLRWSTGANSARMRAIATDLGFYPIMEQRGYDRQTVDRCLGDEAMAKRLSAQTAKAKELGVTGTPGFLLGDLLLAGTYDWPSLRSQIDARL